MRFLNKTLLAWLLIVAIPAQGFAAAAMQMCVPGRHGTPVVVAVQNNHHHSATNHDHASVIQAAHEHNDQATDVTVATDTKSEQGQGKCSACASCCVAPAIVSRLVIGVSPTSTTSLIPFASTSFLSHISDGLDPPPRSILA